MRIGTAFYPERHGRQFWADNFAKMRDAGIARIRIAEFAWSRLETAPGQFTWDWLDESIALAGEYGIEVVLCTPTACPPIWLVEEHPDILPVDRFGHGFGFGARQHRCYNSPAYLEASRRITEAMAARYGEHSSVVAWQIDNELGAEHKTCHCDRCRAAFQLFLAAKYHSVEELNDRWGNGFWSQDYQRFDQVPTPVHLAADIATRHHPSLELEYLRFRSEAVIRFARMQTELLRAHSPGRAITTNAFMFRWGDLLNLRELFDGMDVAGNDVYSIEPYEIACYCDLTRGLKGLACDRFWMMEYGTGSPALPEEMKLLRRHGADWLFLFKFNAFPWGQEQTQRAIMTITARPGPSYEMVRQWTQGGEGQAAPCSLRPRLGVYYHFESSWSCYVDTWYVDTFSQRLTYADYLVHTLYRGLFDATANGAAFAFRAEDVAELDTLIVPRHRLYDADLEERLIAFVRGGGKLIVTADLFVKNSDNVFLTQVPRIYRELLEWGDGDFVFERDLPAEPLIRTCSTGAGRTWLVRSDVDRAGWAKLIREVHCGEEGGAGTD